MREVFDLGETLLFVATDRLSAFDVILPDPIPDRGAVLNQISAFWFKNSPRKRTILSPWTSASFRKAAPFRAQLEGRSMLVRKTKPLPGRMRRARLSRRFWLEGLPGDGRGLWSSVAARFGACLGIAGTDLHSFDQERGRARLEYRLGAMLRADRGESAGRVRDLSLEIYREGKAYAADRGIIVADTKFEFGLTNGEIILIDECLTPDSSRFWPADSYAPGQSPPSFDKQFVRDYLETLDWNKTYPGPSLPSEVIEKPRPSIAKRFSA